MTVKEFLQQYRVAENTIQAKLGQIHNLRELSTKTTRELSGDRVQKSGSLDKVADIVSKIVDMEHEVDEEIDRLQEKKQRVEEVIEKVPNEKQRMVLTRRYINGLTWERIASDMDISYQWVCELHKRAIQKIPEQLIEVDTRPVL